MYEGKLAVYVHGYLNDSHLAEFILDQKDDKFELHSLKDFEIDLTSVPVESI